jgi:hypothetical protein
MLHAKILAKRCVLLVETLLLHQEGHRFALARRAQNFFALTIFKARTSSKVSASIFLSSAFSFSSPLSFSASPEKSDSPKHGYRLNRTR